MPHSVSRRRMKAPTVVDMQSLAFVVVMPLHGAIARMARDGLTDVRWATARTAGADRQRRSATTTARAVPAATANQAAAATHVEACANAVIHGCRSAAPRLELVAAYMPSGNTVAQRR